MPDKLSVRQWQEQFRAGAFDSPDFATQCKAGWGDWFCANSALFSRLKRLAKVVMRITESFILDNYFIFLGNSCTRSGTPYDSIYFSPLTKGGRAEPFEVTRDSPEYRVNWTLTTARFSSDTAEFGCLKAGEMARYIDKLGHELEQDIKPPFLAEKQAVDIYQQTHERYPETPVYRLGAHCYGYVADRKQRTVTASVDLKDMPSGFPAERMEVVNGIYVCCLEDAEMPLPSLRQSARKSQKGKEMER